MTTDPEPMVASDAVAAVLAGHQRRIVQPGNCICGGWPSEPGVTWVDHLAAALAPLLDQARAEGWNEACKGFAWALDNGPTTEAAAYVAESNPYRTKGLS